MDTEIIQGPPGEQEVCVTCGFCCDGTIFGHAHLNPGEKDSIPALMAANATAVEGEEYFLLPCPYFRGKCTIYDIKRAEVCGRYRCQLLKDLEAGKISREDALKVVADARVMRDLIFADFRQLTGSEAGSFRKLITDLGRFLKPDFPMDAGMAAEADLLQARCNIFEALLIRHFRSSDDFNKLIMQ